MADVSLYQAYDLLLCTQCPVIIAVNYRFVWNRRYSYRVEVKGAVGSERNTNFEISLSYHIFASVNPRLDICITLTLLRGIITASHNFVFVY